MFYSQSHHQGPAEFDDAGVCVCICVCVCRTGWSGSVKPSHRPVLACMSSRPVTRPSIAEAVNFGLALRHIEKKLVEITGILIVLALETAALS